MCSLTGQLPKAADWHRMNLVEPADESVALIVPFKTLGILA